MRLFLDTSAILAACGSAAGASYEVFRLAPAQGWTLIVTPYVLEELEANLSNFPLQASAVWARLRSQLAIFDDVVTIDGPVIFDAAKDRPILFSALAWSDVLLTLDRGDFKTLLGGSFYGLLILKPGDFLERERKQGRIG